MAIKKIRTCPVCGKQTRNLAGGLCHNCYRKRREAENPVIREERLAYQRAYDNRLNLPYRKGSWDDPAVQAHHRAMVQKYFGD